MKFLKTTYFKDGKAFITSFVNLTYISHLDDYVHRLDDNQSGLHVSVYSKKFELNCKDMGFDSFSLETNDGNVYRFLKTQGYIVKRRYFWQR